MSSSVAPGRALRVAPGRALRVVPGEHQPPLPADRLILSEPLAADAVPMDVVFVGGGPAGLAGAIELAKLVRKDNEAGGALGDVQIAVLEKAAALGEHSLSGAVVNPRAFRELFPDLKDADFPFRAPVTKERVYLMTAGQAWRIPTPPTMQNHGHYIGSLSEMVRWLGENAEGMGVNIFAGFPAAALMVQGEKVVGVRTTPTGLARDGTRGNAFTPPTDISARVTVLAEGTRGSLAQAFMQRANISSDNPQIFALGVKEVWETKKKPLDAVVHTLGWPLPTDAFGGSFIYPLAPNLVAIGIVVGMDYRQTTLDVHVLLQRLKTHPLVRGYLEGGELVEWGAKTIPEGGYYALPSRRVGDGVMIVGDSAGYVEVASLKGIHYAMQSGIYAARAIFDALKRGDTSAGALAPYDTMVDSSYITSDLRRRRNMRLAFQGGFYVGGVKATLMTLTGGAFPGGKIASELDSRVARAVVAEAPFVPDGKLTFGKLDANFKSGNATRDDIPSHLIIGTDIPPEVAELYSHMCPAGVYEQHGERLVVSAANCIDCKATDVIGPRWTPREGGSGPRYRLM